MLCVSFRVRRKAFTKHSSSFHLYREVDGASLWRKYVDIVLLLWIETQISAIITA